MVLDKADEKIYGTSELELFSSYSKTCSHEQKTISFWKMAGVCYRRSPTAYRVYFGQYQASSVVLGWLHKGDCSLVQERQSGSWPYHHYRKDVWCLLEKFVTKKTVTQAICIKCLAYMDPSLNFLLDIYSELSISLSVSYLYLYLYVLGHFKLSIATYIIFRYIAMQWCSEAAIPLQESLALCTELG